MGLLRELYLRRNKIRAINSSLFPRNIRLLDLSDNLIEFLPSNTFQEMNFLEQLCLDNNLISNKLLFSLGRYQLISLENNQMASFPFFEGETRATYLNLSTNKITSLKSIDFVKFSRLAVLNISNNKVNDIVLRYDTDKLFQALIMLEYLDISYNLLTLENLISMDLNCLSSVTELNLGFNRIDRITSQMFTSLTKLKLLILSGNPILVIETDSFNLLPVIEIISIDSNEIFVSLKDFFLHDSFDNLKKIEITSVNTVYANLATIFKTIVPQKVSGRSFNNIYFYKSINIIVGDFALNNTKADCELTLKFLKHKIQLNLFDDFGYEFYIEKCLSLIERVYST
jgi:Leucine-rich repeat (LRR) protein